jgi:hypothetical protein
MSGTNRGLASHSVSERMKAGDRFGAVEDAIDELAELTADEKARCGSPSRCATNLSRSRTRGITRPRSGSRGAER